MLSRCEKKARSEKTTYSDPPVSVAVVENKPASTTCSDPPAGVENKPASHDVSNKQSLASAVLASTMSGMDFANSTINVNFNRPFARKQKYFNSHNLRDDIISGCS